MHRERFCLAKAVAEATANLSPIIEAKAALVYQVDLPWVMADRTQVIQLFQNLISNSLKYAADGRAPEIHISSTSTRALHHIHVKDNGIGMDSQHLHSVFELFHRLHSHEQYEGTGIGLALCRRIVEHHGGSIWAESVNGAGSTFTFTLPVIREPSQQVV